jgi:hypothetical protein
MAASNNLIGLNHIRMAYSKAASARAYNRL